jgi:hypothetical protein
MVWRHCHEALSPGCRHCVNRPALIHWRRLIRVRRSICSKEPEMLDDKRYFAEFPDEDPENPPKLLHSPELIASLRALERELRPYLQNELAGDTGRPK